MEGMANTLSQLQLTAPDEYFVGLTEEEIAQLINYRQYVVSGTAGSVAPGALVTLTNTNTSATLTTKANIDGSFGVLFGVVAGDNVQLTTNFGRSDSLVAE
jgi:hypothetical protein